MTEPVELYRKRRPTKLSEIVGQDAAIATLKGMGPKDLPHVILLSGPSGVGKTTIARVLVGMLRIGKADFQEINAAEARGIDDVRALQSHMRLSAMQGPYRAFLLDECHKLSGDASTALLKTLEDTPSHVFFFLCTTDPNKLLKTIRSRCTEIKLAAIPQATLKKLVLDTAAAEGKPVAEEIANKIAELADGGARKAMVTLHQIIGLPADKQMAAVVKDDPTATGFEIAQLLMRKAKWADVAKMLEAAKEQEPEGIRRVILGYAQSTLLKSGNRRAYEIIEAFWQPLYDILRPGLVSRCYELCEGRG